ncbi:MAG TPA: Lrp/AsnC ligand binding domain-containing protein [Thermoplasmata archaeon]|jgi:DNA-binding Lrp family transcriptional regulator
MRAYVLVKVAAGKEREALETFQTIPMLEEINFLFGEYDYILTVQASDTAALGRLIATRIRRAPGVVQTMTLLEAPI